IVIKRGKPLLGVIHIGGLACRVPCTKQEYRPIDHGIPAPTESRWYSSLQSTAGNISRDVPAIAYLPSRKNPTGFQSYCCRKGTRAGQGSRTHRRFVRIAHRHCRQPQSSLPIRRKRIGRPPCRESEHVTQVSRCSEEKRNRRH